MSSLKTKALDSTFWSFFETFGNMGLQFVVGIILARLLLPEDYGIIGVLAIFMGISGVLVDGGFKISIIRSKDLSDVDCSTIFYVNLTVSVLVGLLLFASAPSIASFFNKPELVNVTRVFALIPVINGFGLVQSALLLKNLQFKRNAKISIAANVIAGPIAILLAFRDYSYWALVWKAIIFAGIYNLFLWITSRWHPQLIFSFEILKKHFRFSSKLLINGIVTTIFDNIYSFVFGKFFSFKDLGFFTRGKGYVNLVTKTLSIAIQKVSTPLLAATAKDNIYLINTYTKMLRVTTLLIFPATALLAAVAEPMIVFLIGEKWLPAVPYLQILAIQGIIYPVANANFSLFEVLGRSDLILKLTFIGKPVTITVLLITINFSPLVVVWGIAFNSVLGLFISFYFLKKATKQSIINSLKPLNLPFLISISMGLSVYLVGLFLSNYLASGLVFGIQTTIGILITISFFYLLKIEEFFIIKNYLLNRINSRFNS